jgi:ABC-type Na+ transport system ATPase subunit NatA
MGKKWKMCKEINSMITPTIGEIFESSLTGEVYEVRRILDRMVVLKSLNGLSQVLTSKENLNLFYKKMPAIGAENNDFGR